MRAKNWFCAVAVAICSHACGGGSSTDRNGGVTQDPATASGDGGSTSPMVDGSGPSANPGSGPGSDAAAAPGAKTDAAATGLVDQVVEYLTCKPDELNPVVDCLTVKCPMQADPLALATCLADDCAKLVEKVSPKCRDCVVAGIAQDTAGLIQDCLDTRAILGDAGNPLPF